MKITVVGGGAFGTALALSYMASHDVTLWARRAKALRDDRAAPRLPGITIPDALDITDDLSALHDAVVLLALPTQQLRQFLDDIPRTTRPAALVACCKGIDVHSGLGPAELIEAHGPGVPAAVLSGPSFAADIARGLPTALVLAARDDGQAGMLQHTLTARNLRLYRSTDVAGVQFGGALKNVIAIACGTAFGAGLGASARAALMTRGLSEMTRFAAQFGGQAETLAGLSGFGDLVLTSTSDQSRNYRYGLALGQGAAFDAATTVEGVATAQAVVALADAHGLDMPIAATVAAVIEGDVSVQDAMTGLLARPLTVE